METQQLVVPIGKVIPDHEPSSWHIRKMADVLKKQGQIEPLQVYLDGNLYKTYGQDAWGAEIVQAALSLHWDTLLILITPRYLQ